MNARALTACAARLIALGAASACGSSPTPSNAGTPQASPRVTADLRDLVYAQTPRALRLDLFTPAGIPPFPTIVWVHGGGWQAGNKTLNADHPALRQRARGYAVASVEYRLSGEAIFPAQIQDCKAALRWLRAHASEHGLDATRFAAWGSSAGAHLVALVGTSGGVATLEDANQGNASESSRVQAVVDWYGPTQFLLMDPSHHAADSPESRLLGCDIDECPERVAFASPLTYIDSGDPPFLIQHGTKDGTVNPNQSELLNDALLAAGVTSTLTRIDGAGHGGAEFTAAANVAKIEAFLDAQLAPKR